MAAIVKQCDCKSEFQDKTYGKGNRVHNELDKSSECKCTVCGKIKKV